MAVRTLAFKRANLDNPVERAIILATGGMYCHVEVSARDRWFSSNWPEGVRYCDSLGPEFDLVATPYEETESTDLWCDQHVGDEYATAEALLSAIGRAKRVPGKWFCSQVSAYVLEQDGARDIPDSPHPVQLRLWLAGHPAIACQMSSRVVEQWLDHWLHDPDLRDALGSEGKLRLNQELSVIRSQS